MYRPNIDHITREDYKHVYDPSDDTYLFADAIVKEAAMLQTLGASLCLEVGPGTGYLSCELAHALPQAHVCAVDINPYAAHLTSSTFHHNEFSKRTSVIVGDLTTMFRKKGFFDVVLFNPPYVPTEEAELGSTDIEASYAGGLDGRVVTDRFLTLVGNVMVVGGMLYLLLIRENKVPEVVQWLQTHLGDTTIVAEKKRGGEHQFIVRCCKQ